MTRKSLVFRTVGLFCLAAVLGSLPTGLLAYLADTGDQGPIAIAGWGLLALALILPIGLPIAAAVALVLPLPPDQGLPRRAAALASALVAAAWFGVLFVGSPALRDPDTDLNPAIVLYGLPWLLLALLLPAATARRTRDIHRR
jgi:hypothetical protein